MAKMWDLMVMVVKLQALRGRSPNDLLMATLNHLDGLRTLVPSPSCIKLIDAAHHMVVQVCLENIYDVSSNLKVTPSVLKFAFFKPSVL